MARQMHAFSKACRDPLGPRGGGLRVSREASSRNPPPHRSLFVTRISSPLAIGRNTWCDNCLSY